MTPWLLIIICSCSPLWHAEGVESWGGLSTVPSESECRPYIEKALKELSPESPQEAVDTTGSEHTDQISPSADQEGSTEETKEDTANESNVEKSDDQSYTGNDEIINSEETNEVVEPSEVEESNEVEEPSEGEGPGEGVEPSEEDEPSEETLNYGSSEGSETQDDLTTDETGGHSSDIDENITSESDLASKEEQSTETPDEDTTEGKGFEHNEEERESTEEKGYDSEENTSAVTKEDEVGDSTAEEDTSTEENLVESEKSAETQEESEEISAGQEEITDESVESPEGENTDSLETNEELDDKQLTEETKESTEETSEINTVDNLAETSTEIIEDSKEDTKETKDSVEEEEAISESEDGGATSEEEAKSEETTETSTEQEILTEEIVNVSKEEVVEELKETLEDSNTAELIDESIEEKDGTEDQEALSTQSNEEVVSEADEISSKPEESNEDTAEVKEDQEQESTEELPKEPEPTDEDQLTLEFEIPKVRRPRDHIGDILHLTPESAETEILLAKTIDNTLKELKKLYDNAIRPLEILFKYRDLSNRHFGDPEIFSKPLILFMGPWSGGKSTILNYLLDNEFKPTSLRTGAEPSPAYFNIVMWGEREEVLDGTQLAADWTFSGLQKFGQGLLDRLRGLRLNNPLLEKVNIVEIPGILEIRKQVERLFPFNDACQWFIDRADVIFLVYDPSKLDVGPETEAILDQLKGREYQTRIILNKADQVKPEELMRVQGTLIWNISPLMSSQEPPVMYSTSLWSIPYELGSPSRLLHAQERAFLRDIRQAIDKRVENKIASARRFAVRVRNHAKMVDCYLTTYYNHKTFFGNRKKVADDIIEHPQNYHIYEGLSTLTNISRYDLPDPEVYRDFFRLNALYDFQRLSETCTYFRGCPINRLDVSIAYDLPELVGKYKKQAEKVLEAAEKQSSKS